MALTGKPFTGAPLTTGAEWAVLHAPSSTGGVLGAYGGSDLAPSAVTTGSPAPDRTVRIAASATNGVLAAGVRATLATAENAPALASNSSGQNRLDYVVARFDWDLETVVLAVVQGTPASNPARPALTQVPGDQWDEPLALVTVRNGVGVLAAADVLDVRRWALRSAGAFQRAADLPSPANAGFGTVAGRPYMSNGLSWTQGGLESAFRMARLNPIVSGVDNQYQSLNFDYIDPVYSTGATTSGYGYWTAPRDGMVRFDGRVAMYLSTGGFTMAGSPARLYVALMECAAAANPNLVGSWNERRRGTDTLRYNTNVGDLFSSTISTEWPVAAGNRYTLFALTLALGVTKSFEHGASLYFDGHYV